LGSCSSAWAQAADTAATDSTAVTHGKKRELAGRQISIGFDIAHPIINAWMPERYGYELQADYYLRNEFYLIGEGGWGGGFVNYPDLKYNTTNNFFRIGFNKSALHRDTPHDWDMMLVGLRVGYAYVQRGNANFAVVDSLWGNVYDHQPAKSFSAWWAEVTGGMRVELTKRVLAGWNIRAKFLVNSKSFKDLAPLYIAGYGKGDKNSIFDFNVYLSYAIRWDRKHAGEVKPK